MPRKSGQVVVWVIVAKVVEQQKGVEVLGLAESEATMQPHSGAFGGGLSLDNSLDWSDGHWSVTS
jgi:hypothetical protein